MLADCDLTTLQTYSPGQWCQDLITLPLQGALVASLNANIWQTSPLWPFANESAHGNRYPTRHPRQALVWFGAVGTLATLGSAALLQSDYPVLTYARGWLHAHLATELATSWAKISFQRKRPFYDTVAELSLSQHQNLLRQDDRLSFWSGHASHAFAFAAYSSALVRNAAQDSPWSWVYTGAIYSSAAYIGAARAIDGQHHWSDVVVGAFMGAAVAQSIFLRVVDVNKEENKTTFAFETCCFLKWQAHL